MPQALTALYNDPDQRHLMSAVLATYTPGGDSSEEIAALVTAVRAAAGSEAP